MKGDFQDGNVSRLEALGRAPIFDLVKNVTELSVLTSRTVKTKIDYRKLNGVVEWILLQLHKCTLIQNPKLVN